MFKLHQHDICLFLSLLVSPVGQEDIAEESSCDFSPLKEVSVPGTSEHIASEVADEDESQVSPKSWQQVKVLDLHVDKNYVGCKTDINQKTRHTQIQVRLK